MLLSQAIRRAGRVNVAVPSPLAPLVGRALHRAGVADFSPEQVRFLSYGRVVDTTAMRKIFGFAPRYTTVEAYDEFVAGQSLRGPLSRDNVASLERAVLAFAGSRLERRAGA
jgi:UDP-glucose 4-epimerase